jgi:glycine/D-amino acid oxidase-like deaminating enzyme
MTVVGLGFGVMARLKGHAFMRDAHRYMERAVDGLEALVREHGLACDMIRPGFLRMALAPAHVRRLRDEIALMRRLGIEGIDWLDAGAARDRVHSSRYLGAMWEPRLLLVDPAKLVREEKRLAQALGAEVFEHTPVTAIRRERAFTLETPAGSVRCERLVLATNAYSVLVPELRRKQTPAFTYMIATEPLSPHHLAVMGWAGREGVEDARNLIHYYRLSPENRLVMGGGPVGLGWHSDLSRDTDPAAWRHLETHARTLFPVLHDVRVTHRWGGPFSVTLDLTPALGRLGDPRCVYALGCIGHGVAMTHQNALTLVDLLLERRTENTECPFVDRRVIPWPPEPLRSLAARAVRACLRAEDWWHERGMPA